MIEAKPKAKAPARSLFVGQSAEHAPPSDDFVDDVLALLASLVPGITAEQCAAAGAAVRQRWGGDRPYIARRAGEGRSGRNEAIRRDFKRGESVALLSRRHQISRMSVYRVLGLESAE